MMFSRVPPLHPGLDDEESKNTEVIKAGTNAPDDKPGGISPQIWEKFQLLQKKREAVSKKSTDRRIKDLQSRILNRVKEEFTSEEDQKILGENDVCLDHHVPDKQASRKRKSDEVRSIQQSSIADEEPSVSGRIVQEDHEGTNQKESWTDVKKYMGAQDHLRAPHKEQHVPKNQLEKRIDEALTLGDVETAEKLSDHLANREFGKRIADAFDAKRYAEDKQKEEQSAKAKKKKKLNWGFDHKQKWETKGNM